MLPRLAPLVLVIAAAPLAGGPASHARPAKVTFGTPVHVSADDTQAAAEPSIRTARDGTIYIVAPTGIGGVRTQEGGTGGDLLWRSEDGGKTWTYLTSYDQAAGGGDADLAVDDAGVIWASGLTLANTTAAVSTDKGDTFKVNPVGSITTGLVDRQWIETHKDDTTAYMTTGSDGIILTQLMRTPGDEPVAEKTITVSRPDDQYQWPGELTIDDETGDVFVSYNTVGKPKNHDEIIVTRSDPTLDEAQTKQFVVRKTRGDSFDSFTVVDADKAGNLYAAWNERRHRKHHARRGKTVTYLAVSKDHGETWSKAYKVNHAPRTTVFPWLVAGSDGRVAVVYYGTRARGPNPNKVVRKGERRAPKWYVYASYSMNATSSHPRFTEVKAVKKFIHKGNICTSGTGCASGTRDLLDFFQDDLDPCGRVVITYTDNSADVVDKTGNRTTNSPELVSFVGQTGGPRFYTQPLDPTSC